MVMSFPLVYAQENSILLEVEKFNYFVGEKINISGSVQEILFGQEVNFMIIGPNGDVISIEKISMDKSKQFKIHPNILTCFRISC